MVETKLLRWIILLGALGLAFYLLRPLLTAIVFAAVAAIFFLPAHDWLKKKISANASASILTIICMVILGLFIFMGINIILTDFSKIYAAIANFNYARYAPAGLAETFENTMRFILSKIITYLSSFVSQLPHIMLSIFIFFVTFFFFLKDGRKMYSWVTKNLPIQNAKKNEIFKELKAYTRAFIRVWILIGIIQAIVAFVGFCAFKLPYPLLAAIIAFTISVLPMIGAYALFLVTGAALILQGNLFAGIGILAYGLPISISLDYVLRPYLAGKLADIHPLLILLGMTGGLVSVGLAGIIIGPVALLIITALVKSSLGNKNAIKE